MSPRHPERLRRSLRWLVPGALFALAPKCGLCVAGYLGLAGALGLGGAEICGAPHHGSALRAVGFLAAGAAVGAVGLFLRARWARHG